MKAGSAIPGTTLIPAWTSYAAVLECTSRKLRPHGGLARKSLPISGKLLIPTPNLRVTSPTEWLHFPHASASLISTNLGTAEQNLSRSRSLFCDCGLWISERIELQDG